MKKVVVDTSVIIAVLLNEPHKKKLIEITDGCELLAPPSIHWEVGNAMSSLLKRGLLTQRLAEKAIKAYAEIPIQFSDISLNSALKISAKQKMYAYDAYILACAQKHRVPILTLDTGLVQAARETGIRYLEV